MMDRWLVGASTLKKPGMRGFARFFYVVALMAILVVTSEEKRERNVSSLRLSPYRPPLKGNRNIIFLFSSGPDSVKCRTRCLVSFKGVIQDYTLKTDWTPYPMEKYIFM